MMPPADANTAFNLQILVIRNGRKKVNINMSDIISGGVPKVIMHSKSNRNS